MPEGRGMSFQAPWGTGSGARRGLQVGETRSLQVRGMTIGHVDPYKGYRFKVKVGNEYVMACNRVGPLRRTTQVVESRSGGDSSATRKSPGQTSFDPIVLEAGITHDTTFETWANDVASHGHPVGSPPGAPPTDFRKNIRIELVDEAGQIVVAYNVYRCWPSEYQALPALGAGAADTAITTIKLENEGWERDTSVAEAHE